MHYLLGIDLGTSSVRVILIDENSKICGIAGIEYPISVPKKDWAEQDPEIWWKATRDTIQKVLLNVNISPCDIKGIGLSGQMHGTVFMGRNNLPLRPAIIWPDNRSIHQCNKLNETIGSAEIYKIVGLPTATGFMAPSVMWVKEHEPEVVNNTVKLLLPKDYIRFKLTGKMATDYTDATGTLFLDIVSRKWSERVVQAAEINFELLPKLLDSSAIAGEVTNRAAQETGLIPGTPVIAGGGDQAMGAIGCGLVRDGMAVSTIGTGGQLNVCVSKPVFDPGRRIHTLCHVVKNKWILMGAVLSAGLSLRWYRDNFVLEIGEQSAQNIYKVFDKEAEKVPPGSNGLIFLPYLSGDRTPHMDTNARGGFIGLTLQHGKSQLVRSIMEGVGFAMMDSFQIFKQLGVQVESMLCSGGGARSNVWKQIQADIYGMPVKTVSNEEHSSFGAALLAGVGVNIFQNIEKACQKSVSYIDTTHSIPENVEIYQELYEIYCSLYPKLKDTFIKLGKAKT